MSRSSYTLQVKYQENNLEGKVIEHIKKTERNASDFVRNYLVMLRGYDVLKSGDASPEEIIDFCTQCVGFFHTQNEIARIRLSEELKKKNAIALLSEDFQGK
ncbi:MAG: hypothetical protein ACRC1Z_15825 [Waterburya sp.]